MPRADRHYIPGCAWHITHRCHKREFLGQEVIPQTMQLVARRTGQEYNLRKNRKGAFWEDRYHATAVQADSHLVQCMVYIDLNMVRAGVVPHPSEWPFCGYHEILNTRQRYTLIDHESLILQRHIYPIPLLTSPLKGEGLENLP